MTVRHRPVLPSDEEFLFSLYASTRMEEIDLVDWNTAQKGAFLYIRIGSFLRNRIRDKAAQKDLPVTIHIERFNPALKLYERLGFRSAQADGCLIS